MKPLNSSSYRCRILGTVVPSIVHLFIIDKSPITVLETGAISFLMKPQLDFLGNLVHIQRLGNPPSCFFACHVRNLISNHHHTTIECGYCPNKNKYKSLPLRLEYCPSQEGDNVGSRTFCPSLLAVFRQSFNINSLRS